MNCKIKQKDINKEVTEVLVLGGYEDDKTLPKRSQGLDKALGGQLQELRKSGEFTGENQQSVLIHTRGTVPAKRILLIGLGKKKELTILFTDIRSFTSLTETHPVEIIIKLLTNTMSTD